MPFENTIFQKGVLCRLELCVYLSLVALFVLCVAGVGVAAAKPKETHDDKIAFALGALDTVDPFTKHVPLDSDLIGAVEWMAKVCKVCLASVNM